mmetsp:Transcript_93348/g.264258  ORF Transcript_93348/g.264258 Transcript_93348/m.264258 type:complete len:436 (-) Transcript_93348:287-1594(-)
MESPLRPQTRGVQSAWGGLYILRFLRKNELHKLLEVNISIIGSVRAVEEGPQLFFTEGGVALPEQGGHLSKVQPAVPGLVKLEERLPQLGYLLGILPVRQVGGGWQQVAQVAGAVLEAKLRLASGVQGDLGDARVRELVPDLPVDPSRGRPVDEQLANQVGHGLVDREEQGFGEPAAAPKAQGLRRLPDPLHDPHGPLPRLLLGLPPAGAPVVPRALRAETHGLELRELGPDLALRRARVLHPGAAVFVAGAVADAVAGQQVEPADGREDREQAPPHRARGDDEVADVHAPEVVGEPRPQGLRLLVALVRQVGIQRGPRAAVAGLVRAPRVPDEDQADVRVQVGRGRRGGWRGRCRRDRGGVLRGRDGRVRREVHPPLRAALALARRRRGVVRPGRREDVLDELVEVDAVVLVLVRAVEHRAELPVSQGRVAFAE